jgi:hypothetical protein
MKNAASSPNIYSSLANVCIIYFTYCWRA